VGGIGQNWKNQEIINKNNLEKPVFTDFLPIDNECFPKEKNRRYTIK